MVPELIGLARQESKKRKCEKSWRKKNAHNHTSIGRCFDVDRVSVGKCTYGILNVYLYGEEGAYLQIGSFCSIAEDVTFMFGEHDYKNMSTFPFYAYVLKERELNYSKGPIIVGDDVWIGHGCIILSGVTIGQGAVIGAGSVVRKNVPPYAVVSGGEVVKYRFEPDVVEKLVKIHFDRLEEDLVKNNIRRLYQNVDQAFFDTDLYKQLTE